MLILAPICRVPYLWDSTERGQNQSDTKSCWYQELMKNGLNKGKVSRGRFDCEMVKC